MTYEVRTAARLKMAAVRSFWLKQMKERTSEGVTGCRKWWKGCIFQHVWREACLANTEGVSLVYFPIYKDNLEVCVMIR